MASKNKRPLFSQKSLGHTVVAPSIFWKILSFSRLFAKEWLLSRFFSISRCFFTFYTLIFCAFASLSITSSRFYFSIPSLLHPFSSRTLILQHSTFHAFASSCFHFFIRRFFMPFTFYALYVLYAFFSFLPQENAFYMPFFSFLAAKISEE